MKRIFLSLLSIGTVSAAVFGATKAFFTDVEKSEGNTLAAGIIDIAVDGENPWTATYSSQLADMKPSQTRYIEFTIKNLEGSNDVNLWKRIIIKSQEDGIITEPECTEGGGTWIGKVRTDCTVAAECCIDGYTPRNNLAAYTLYDLWVCYDPIPGTRCTTNPVTHEPSFGVNWIPIIKADQYVRLDNVNGSWVSLGQLDKGKELKVVQSYHLSSWPNAPEPEVTNWAQGDVLIFDIELMAMQLNAPGPTGVQASVDLENKNPTTWEPITSDDIGGILSYNTSGPTFNYSFTGKVPQVSTAYCLIYYADPWPGDGKTHSTGMVIACNSSDSDRNLNLSGSLDLGTDLPNADDQNYPGGAKLWVVLDADYDNANRKMTGWNPTEYLFEMNLITYKDADL